MKSYSSILFLITLITFSNSAWTLQQDIRKPMIEKMQNKKWEYILSQIEISNQQATLLKPLFNQYELDKRNIILNSKPFKSKDVKNDADASALLDRRFEISQQMLQLQEQYKPRFLKIITPIQLLNFRRAEKEFTAKIIELRKAKQALK